jgi:putative addiction module component (TIGR02574 family)
MRQHAEAVLREALNLPEEERTEIATALLESLGPETELDVATAWRQEVAARIGASGPGRADATPWEQVRDGFLARLSERRPG